MIRLSNKSKVFIAMMLMAFIVIGLAYLIDEHQDNKHEILLYVGYVVLIAVVVANALHNRTCETRKRFGG